MKSPIALQLTFLALWSTTNVVAQPLPAFPGADGAAANVTGGRGGLVYHVTKVDRTFNDNSEGTLRYGLNDSNFGGQARTIVFDVAGTFWLGRYGADRGHDNGWDTQSRLNWGSNVTVAGQTAPGPVYIMGGGTKANGTNNIIRNVTIAPGYGLRNFSKPDEGIDPTPGDFPDSYVYDAIDISGQGIMIDHVTTIYATDETISMNEVADDVTVQYSSISQGQNYPQADAEGGGSYTGHALGSLIQPGSNANISIHHNLYAHQKGRLPRVGTEQSALTDPSVGGYNDFRNNVFYNWFGTAGQGASNQPSQNNFVNNFYLAGPGGDNPIGGSNPGVQHVSGGTGIFSGSSSTKVYAAGNLKDTNKDGDASDTSAASYTGNLQGTPFSQTPFYGVTDTAQGAYDRVLDYMGARWWDRDLVDSRIVNEVRTGTGKIVAWADDPFNDDPNEGTEWRALLALRADPATGAAPFNRPANWDTDRDGLPDHWELQHGLSTDDPSNNGDFDADGYTNLEEYLNELAAWPAPNPIVFQGSANTRYAETLNWDIRWQPSRFDTAVITGGQATVDAVGQHAGTIQVGADGELAIAGGWLKVANEIAIGTGGEPNAAVRMSGGELFTPLLTRGTLGTFELTGGKLHADYVDFDLHAAGGTIAPGDGLGLTVVAGNVSFDGDSTLEIDLASANSDLLGVMGDLDLGTGTALNLLELDSITASTYVVAEYTGTLTGMFDSVTAGFRVDYSLPGQILVHVATVLTGDFNGDGVVNFADYTVWRDHLGSTYDLNGNGDETGSSTGVVDAADYLVWKASFGEHNMLIGGTSPVPESSALALLGIFLACWPQRSWLKLLLFQRIETFI